jgi:8-oxo-dGTP pyrophosphatase MutT (NUDIX family)
LLAHPTRAQWTNSYHIPKGAVEMNEFNLDAAIRETFEEIGIRIPKEKIKDTTERYIDYTKANSTKVYKRVYYFLVDVDDMNLPDIIGKDVLQLDEMDYAAFYDKRDAEKLIFTRFIPILEHLQ